MRRCFSPVDCARTALLAVALAGCATSGPQRDSWEPVSITTGSGQHIQIQLTREGPSVPGHVEASPDRVWDALLAVYTALDAPLDTYVEDERRIGAGAWLTREIAGERMSKWVRCGAGLTGQHADTHRVTLSVTSTVEPEGAGSVITTRVDGTARSVAGTSSVPVRCTSKGTLESLVVKAVRELVADSSGTAGPST